VLAGTEVPGTEVPGTEVAGSEVAAMGVVWKDDASAAAAGAGDAVPPVGKDSPLDPPG
jgi:hypothetical protein